MFAARGYKGPISDHFDGVVFSNYGKPEVRQLPPDETRLPLWKWIPKMLWGRNGWQRRANTAYPKPAARVDGSAIVVTFVGHSTMLIQTEGLNIITDPVWAERASPFRFAGPRRFRAPGIRLEDLPPIDIVLLSHNHYDHMDVQMLKHLSKKWSPTIYTGLGNKEYLEERGILNVREMDWWGKEVYKNLAGTNSPGITIACMPAQHFSSRGFTDRNKTLWCGFVIETQHGNIYFAGDTGYGDFIDMIKSKYSGFRLAIIPIGAFKPQWFMSTVHVSPDEAFRMHAELKAQISLAIHFGTFKLAMDTQDEAARRIKELSDDFRVLDIGESVILPK